MTSIVVDGNNLGIGSHFANIELADSSGRPTGAIYGFIRTIRPILARVQRETGDPEQLIKVVVAWDSMTSWRKELLPSYKEKRKEIKTEEASEQFERYADQLPRLLDLTRALGIGQVRADNFEADDIAGYFANISENPVVLVSNDYDWLQLVSKQVHVWRTLKGEYVTPANFTNYTGCEDAEEYIKTKAICGDKDEVPGVPGVGPKFAQRYLRGDLKKGKKFDAIAEWMDLEDGYSRSYSLFDLRKPKIPADAWRLTRGQFDVAAIQHQMGELSFNSILGDFADWIDPFKKSSQA